MKKGDRVLYKGQTPCLILEDCGEKLIETKSGLSMYTKCFFVLTDDQRSGIVTADTLSPIPPSPEELSKQEPTSSESGTTGVSRDFFPIYVPWSLMDLCNRMCAVQDRNATLAGMAKGKRA